MFALFLATSALAEPAFQDAGFLLAGSGEFALGVGAPTVDHDPVAGQFVMYFESPLASVPSDCANGYQIGRATSPDGLDWTVDPTPVVTPDTADSTSLHHCSVSQPAVVYDGSTWHLLYSQAGAKATTSATSNTATGVGYATSEDGVHFTLVGDPAVPAGSAPMGLSSAAIVFDTLYLLYSDYPDVMLATLPLDGSTTFTTTGPVMDNAAQPWSTTWLLGPSLLCVDGDTPTFETFLGGDASGVRSLALATSDDASAWTFDAETPLDGGDLDYSALKHWDVLGDNAGAYWLWYSADDPSTGLKAIGGAFTDDAEGAPQERYCDGYVPPEPGGDTGTVDTGTVDTGTVDTGALDTGDTGTADTADDDDDDDHGHGGWGCGWGCTERRTSPWGLVPAGALSMVLVGRRRRR